MPLQQHPGPSPALLLHLLTDPVAHAWLYKSSLPQPSQAWRSRPGGLHPPAGRAPARPRGLLQAPVCVEEPELPGEYGPLIRPRWPQRRAPFTSIVGAPLAFPSQNPALQSPSSRSSQCNRLSSSSLWTPVGSSLFYSTSKRRKTCPSWQCHSGPPVWAVHLPPSLPIFSGPGCALCPRPQPSTAARGGASLHLLPVQPRVRPHVPRRGQRDPRHAQQPRVPSQAHPKVQPPELVRCRESNLRTVGECGHGAGEPRPQRWPAWGLHGLLGQRLSCCIPPPARGRAALTSLSPHSCTVQGQVELSSHVATC